MVAVVRHHSIFPVGTPKKQRSEQSRLGANQGDYRVGGCSVDARRPRQAVLADAGHLGGPSPPSRDSPRVLAVGRRGTNRSRSMPRRVSARIARHHSTEKCQSQDSGAGQHGSADPVHCSDADHVHQDTALAMAKERLSARSPVDEERRVALITGCGPAQGIGFATTCA